MDNQMMTTTEARVSESRFISKVYMWMSMGLMISTAACFWLMAQPALLTAVFTKPFVFFGIIIAEFALVVWLSAAAMRLSPFTATILFSLYSFLNGITLTGILLVYTGSSVLTTFAVTAGTFLFFSVYGMTTKKDLTGIGSLAMMALFGVILASLVNIFLKSSGLTWIITFVGIGVFLALIAYDTQKLKALHAMGFDNPEMEKKVAILGALTLYLDFINLFIMLLRIFGRQRD